MWKAMPTCISIGLEGFVESIEALVRKGNETSKQAYMPNRQTYMPNPEA